MSFIFACILAARYSRTFSDLEKAHDDLLVLDKMKDDFLATTTHELKTPLHGIMGLSSSLSGGALGPLSEVQKENLNLITSSAEQLSGLVGEILDFSKVRAGKADLFLERVDAADTVRTVLSLMRAAPEAEGLELREEIEPGLPPLTADRGRLRQALINLVGNALKFTDEGSVTVALSREKDFLRFEVRDTGAGVDPAVLPRIFEPFVQGESPDTRRAGGTGLGLSITKRLVELHGGTIEARSDPGRGSVFVMRLPLDSPAQGIGKRPRIPEASPPLPAALPAAPLTEEQSAPVTDPTRARKPRILVVDDDPVNLRVVGNICTAAGYVLDTAESGPRCLEMLQSGTYDLVLLDLMLPGMSGFEVCERVRARSGGDFLPVIMVTARDAASDIVRGFSLGANDYLTKPFRGEELVARVENQLAIRKMIDIEKALAHGLESEKTRMSSLLERCDGVRESALQLLEWEKIISQDMDIARSFQGKLMTREEVPGVEWHAHYEPLEKLGGDVYDIFEFRPGVMRLFLADATGHGIQASLNTVKILAEYSAVKETLSDPATVMNFMNRRFVQYLREYGIVFSCVVADVDLARGRVRMASAGHPEQYFFGGKGGVETLKPPGPIIGVSHLVEYAQKEHPFALGDTLMFFTDGLLELAPHGEAFRQSVTIAGTAFVDAMAEGLAKKGPLDRILEKAMKGGLLYDRQHRVDDITVILVRNTGGTSQ